MNPRPLPTAVLISGRGSNLKALIDARDGGALNLDLRGVISNRPGAAGLEFARAADVPELVVDHHDYPDRPAHEAAVAEALDRLAPELIVLAGYMRVLTAPFVARYLGRMINLHPSLLPRYPGLKTHERALEAGDAWHGSSVHFVTPDLDAGPVLAQVRLRMRPDDDPETLAARLLPLEHQLLVSTVELFCDGRVQWRDGRVLLDGQPLQRPLVLEDDGSMH
ncbi:MAG: phosphoribosylglycinamide formyltransferase [Xanthomonadales bacterium]|nr:phosphoribosylglycinamide formyltransferase [Xanthomonadales bacterium]